MYKFNQFLLRLSIKYPKLSRFLKHNYGLIPDTPRETDYIAGIFSSLDKKILQPDGQWTDYLPTDEKQQGRYVETMACTCFSLLNVLEMLAKKREFGDWNKSDRFTAKMSGVTQNGNSMNVVLDSVRKLNGTVQEQDWPADIDNFNWSQFYAPVPQNIKDKGIIFVNDYEVGYEVVSNAPQALKQALTYSPLYVAGSAWAENSKGLYYTFGGANHAFTIVGYKDGEYWLAFDSYPEYLKKLAWNFQITYPKIVTLNLRGQSYNKIEIQNLISRGFIYIMRVLASGQIYRLDGDKLTYISPEEWNKINVQLSADQKKLVGISEDVYNKLLA